MTNNNEQCGEEFTIPLSGSYLDRMASQFNLERNGMTDEQLREKIAQILESAYH